MDQKKIKIWKVISLINFLLLVVAQGQLFQDFFLIYKLCFIFFCFIPFFVIYLFEDYLPLDYMESVSIQLRESKLAVHFIFTLICIS